MLFFKLRLLPFSCLLLLSLLPSAHAGDNDGTIYTEFEMLSKDPQHTGILSGKVTAVQLSGSQADNQTAADYLTANKHFEVEEIVVPDDSTDFATQITNEVNQLSPNLKADITEVIPAPRKIFPEWFKENKKVLSIMTFQFTLVSGITFTEVLFTGAPVSHASIMLDAVLTAGVTAGIEWNMPPLLAFLKTHGPMMKNLFAIVSSRAKNEVVKANWNKFLGTFWQLTKSSALNFGIINVLKFITFATVVKDETLNMFLNLEGTFAIEAAGVAVITIPTTELIIKHYVGKMKDRGEDISNPVKVFGKLRVPLSVAFSERAIAIGMLVMAGELKNPVLGVIGGGILLTVSGASFIANLTYNRLKTFFCGSNFDPKGAQQIENQIIESGNALPDAN